MSPLSKPAYNKRPFYLWNKHLETIVPSLIFTSTQVPYKRKRLALSDGDFVDLDWLISGHKRLIVLSHGLEGNTHRYYMTRMANYFHQRKWDILAWNTRGCGGEMYRELMIVHHGFQHDLEQVVNHALTHDYDDIVLIGMSMGGSHSVKYLSSGVSDPRIAGAVCFSVTGDMKDMVDQVEKRGNWIYKRIFLNDMKNLVRKLALLHPDKVDATLLNTVKGFEEFLQLYTVPFNKFKSLEEFYYDASTNNFLSGLNKPTLIVNALNDPLLGAKCHPKSIAEKSRYLHLETPKYGGHLGFNYARKPFSYMEIRAEAFIANILNLS